MAFCELPMTKREKRWREWKKVEVVEAVEQVGVWEEVEEPLELPVKA